MKWTKKKKKTYIYFYCHPPSFCIPDPHTNTLKGIAYSAIIILHGFHVGFFLPSSVIFICFVHFYFSAIPNGGTSIFFGDSHNPTLSNIFLFVNIWSNRWISFGSYRTLIFCHFVNTCTNILDHFILHSVHRCTFITNIQSQPYGFIYPFSIHEKQTILSVIYLLLTARRIIEKCILLFHPRWYHICLCILYAIASIWGNIIIGYIKSEKRRSMVQGLLSFCQIYSIKSKQFEQ